MHYSAKRGIAIACRPSVRLWRWWIRIQDHISWESWKLITRREPNTFAWRPSTYCQGNVGKFWGD